ncbi:helix-turn-helix domain-containing protein [Agromyces mediolanus]|uniref:helix-turn-helix transcriptional regulator n=1 Tax=Agromyces mediolanus TaxID=41986 RepID=UPI00203B7FFE|nr:helix-turn-helix domain-containing protein [Agromyces mediolanus]MCM3655749.1 helix-turn-helix domain-containing protein [Agromyces mediolanus]
MHYQTVGYLERGEFNPSLHLALRIARFFEVPVEFVFSLHEFPRIAPDGMPRRSARPRSGRASSAGPSGPGRPRFGGVGQGE